MTDARAEVRRMFQALAVQTILSFVALHWVVVPALTRWHLLIVPAVPLILYAAWWSHRYMRRATRYLAWSEKRALAEETGDAITLLGLTSSPDSARPEMWPAFWWRLWGIKP